MRSFVAAAALATTILSTALPTLAADDQNFFVMGGPFARDYFSDAVTPWDNTYESNFFAGVGYQKFFYDYGAFSLGVEAGIGLRAGYRPSAEVWGGAVARLELVHLGDITITPSLTAGLSIVADTIGVETERANAIGRDVPLLYYLGPEIAVSHAALPNFESFARLQHRSGGFGTIANIDGSNAVVMGLRYKF